jgi:hypothetical protein
MDTAIDACIFYNLNELPTKDLITDGFDELSEFHTIGDRPHVIHIPSENDGYTCSYEDMQREETKNQLHTMNSSSRCEYQTLNSIVC